MKNLIYLTFGIAVIFSACAKETSVAPNDSITATKVSEKRAIANQHFINTKQKNNDLYRLTEGVDPTPKLLNTYLLLNKEAMESNWEVPHQIGKDVLTPVLGDKNYTFDIQAISYKLLHQKLLLEQESSDELDEAILFYFTALMNTKAEDLGMLTMTLKRIEHKIEPEKLAEYKTYILMRADKDLARYIPLVEEQKQKLEQSADEDYNIRRHVLGFQDRVDDAKLAIKTFSNS